MNKEEVKICMTCEHCNYIGEGDYVCFVDDTPQLVMEDHSPSDMHIYCGLADWEPKE